MENIVPILILAICIAILVKTGKISNAIGFVLKWLLYPGIFAFIGCILGILVNGIDCHMGILIGTIVGFIIVFKDASKKLK